MSQVAIVTDSTGILPKELLEQYPIIIVPMHIFIGDKDYRSDIDITPEEFYPIFRKSRELIHTSACSLGDFLATFRNLNQQGKSILCLPMSSKLSSFLEITVQAERMFKEEFPEAEIEVIDTMTTIGGVGLLSLAAAQASVQGMSLTEVAQKVREIQPKLTTMFMLDTLRYLASVGRAGTAAPWAESELDLKPIVETPTSFGVPRPIARERTRARALQRMLELMKERVGKSPVYVIVQHTDCLEEAQKFKEEVSAQFNCVEIYLSDISLAAAVQNGPGMIALCYYPEGFLMP
jgi:DegV family protein with EDD domain